MNHSPRNCLSLVWPLLAICVLLTIRSSARAVTRTWVTFGSGDFDDPNNWFPSGTPGAGDFVSFETGFSPYTVTFPGGNLGDPVVNYTTNNLWVRDPAVTFDGSAQALRGPSSYTVASTTETEANRGIVIGVLSGDDATLDVSHSGFFCCGGLSSFSGVAATLGDAASANGTLNMSFGTFNVTGSDFTQTQLIVGNNGGGTLNVSSGAQVNVNGFNSTASLGHHASGSGAVTISGAGSTWNNSNQLWIGESGSGTLTVQDGGSLVTSSAAGFSNIIGVFGGATGMATVTGAGSSWTTTNGLTVGNSGNGSLMITNGGTFTSTGVKIGEGSSAGGTVTVSGPGSTWNNSGSINVGSTGIGAVAITSGGSVTSGTALIRGLNSGSGQVLVTGTGSTWNVTGSGGLQIGLPEPGFTTGQTKLTINPGATVTVDGDIDVNINGRLELHGGTLDANDINFLNGGGDFDWTAGILHVRNFSRNLLNQGGTLAPGHSPGRTTITGGYTQQQGATLEIEIGGLTPETDYDVVELLSTINLGAADLAGQLQLKLLNGFVPAAQDTFTILTAPDGITGAFDNVANGDRLNTADGSGSFAVHYGPASALDPNEIVLTDFALAALPGDYNHNGVVDAADYVLWRKNPNNFGGDPGGYDTWRAHFGQTAASGAALSSAAPLSASVPEPATFVLSLLALISPVWRRRPTRQAIEE